MGVLQSRDASLQNVLHENGGIPQFRLEVCEVLDDVQQDHGKNPRG